MTASTYPIPRGWRRVTQGRTRKGDKAWTPLYNNRENGYWAKKMVWAIGAPVADYWCIIRRVGKGGAG